MADEDKQRAEGPADQRGTADSVPRAVEPISGTTGRADTSSRQAPTDVHAYIGRQLRAVYDDVAKQPVPDRFLELMKQLEVTETLN